MSIEDRLAALEARVARLESGGGAKSGGAPTMTDAELDNDKYGDFEIKRDPSEKHWKGESKVGLRISQTSPEYCDAFAKWKRASAYMKRKSPTKPEDTKYADYDEKDAARAEAWARRMRAQLANIVAPSAAATEAARYGTTGHGANAKHTAPPEVPFETADLMTDEFDGIF